MADGRQRVWNQVLGPRALAVISCALALMASQPASASPAVVHSSSFVRMTGPGIVGRGGEIVEVGEERVRKMVPVVVGMPAAGPRLRILATVEILQRLLAYELAGLRPIERHLVPALLFEAAWGVRVEFVCEPPYRVVEVCGTGGIGAERDFAIARCLLAPPLA